MPATQNLYGGIKTVKKYTKYLGKLIHLSSELRIDEVEK
jgi:hypothetical protein